MIQSSVGTPLTVPLTQAQIDTKQRLFFTGNWTLTASLSVTTIGQQIVGPGVNHVVTQNTSGANGFTFTTGSDVLQPGGGGVYFNGIEGFQLAQAHANTGVGAKIGGTDPTHEGDWFYGSDLYFTGWQTAMHFNSMAMGYLDGVVINSATDTPGDIGILVTGGSANSHLWKGVCVGNTARAVVWEGGGVGNWIQASDITSATTAFDLGAGFHGTISGGNMEASVTGDVLFLGSNSRTLVIGVGGQGSRTTPALNANGGNPFIMHINTAIGRAAGVMLTQGAGYGNTMGMEFGFVVDTTYDGATGTTPNWKELPFPSVFRAALTAKMPADADHYGAVAHVIRDGTGHGGLVRVSQADDASYFYDWICTETKPAADGTVTPITSITRLNNTITAIS